MKEMLKYLKPYWKGILSAMGAVTAATICDLLLPTIMSDILNEGVYQKDLGYILRCCGVMLVVSLAGLGAVLLSTRMSCNVVASFCADVRAVVFRKVNQMTFEEFGKLGTAALVTRATQDVQTVSWVASDLCSNVAAIPILFFGGVALAMSKDVMLSLTLLAFVPVIMLVVLHIGKKNVALWEKSDEYIDRQSDIMRERLRGIRVIRAFNSEEKEHGRIKEATQIMSEHIIRGNIAMGLITPLATLLLNIATVLIVYFSGWQMERGSGLTGGDVFAIVQYVSLISSGLITGAFTIIMFPQARVSADRIGQVLSAEAMADPVARQELCFTGDIRFDHVDFCYEGASEYALRDINLHIAPGQKVAVIGGTGAGKSTLVSMLLGFRMPTGGEVRLDGIPTTRLSRYSLRENMSCVLQNATIYSGTIRENVKMGKLSATDEEILEALRVAQATEFVDSFAGGLDHEIRQSGKNLSGGQKQRLSIARAVLKNAPIFIFDDSFSALDFLTEANLRSALAKRNAGKTQIIITQRITSAMHCDCIFVLDKGELVGAGNHLELMESCRVYREIYDSQTGGGSNEREEE